MDTPTAVEVVPTKITEPFAGGFYAGRIRVGDEVYALIVAPKEGGEHDDVKWNGNSKRLDGASSFFDGRANTEAMAAAGSKLAKWALGLTLGGCTDWYLPSRDELEILYRAFKPMKDANSVWRHGDNPSSVPPGYPYTEKFPAQAVLPEFQEGGAEAFTDTWYWTSTQYAGGVACAWYQYFSNGTQTSGHKDYDLRARAVRRLKI